MSGVDRRLRALLEESGIPEAGSEDLAALLASLEAGYVDDAPPEPGPELAALLGGGGGAPTTASTKQTRSARRGHRAAVSGFAALGVVLGTGFAAAANELPAQAQHWVAEFSQRYLPFALPYPESPTPGGAPESSWRDRTPRWPDEHDARPTPSETSEQDGPSPVPSAHHEDPPEVDDGYPDRDESSETALEDEREEVAQEREHQAETTPDRTRETSGTEEVESGEASDSDDEPAASTGDAPEESVDD